MPPLTEAISIPTTPRISGQDNLEGPFCAPSCLCSHLASSLPMSNLPFTWAALPLIAGYPQLSVPIFSVKCLHAKRKLCIYGVGCLSTSTSSGAPVGWDTCKRDLFIEVPAHTHTQVLTHGCAWHAWEKASGWGGWSEGGKEVNELREGHL